MKFKKVIPSEEPKEFKKIVVSISKAKQGISEKTFNDGVIRVELGSLIIDHIDRNGLPKLTIISETDGYTTIRQYE